jgi:hypothetical protein
VDRERDGERNERGERDYNRLIILGSPATFSRPRAKSVGRKRKEPRPKLHPPNRASATGRQSPSWLYEYTFLFYGIHKAGMYLCMQPLTRVGSFYDAFGDWCRMGRSRNQLTEVGLSANLRDRHPTWRSAAFCLAASAGQFVMLDLSCSLGGMTSVCIPRVPVMPSLHTAWRFMLAMLCTALSCFSDARETPSRPQKPIIRAIEQTTTVMNVNFGSYLLLCIS